MMQNFDARPSLPPLLAVAFTALIGCGPLDDARETDQQVSEIKNGTASATDYVVLVRLTATGEICTGTLVRNDVVLTAEHCTQGRTLGSIKVRVGATDFDVVDKDEIQPFHPLDATLLRLERPIAVGGSTEGWSLDLVRNLSELQALAGTNVTCIGYGLKTCNGVNDAGAQRTGTVRVKAASDSTLAFSDVNNNQVQAAGDSGGACFTAETPPRITGVNRTASCQPTGGGTNDTANQSPASSLVPWFDAVLARWSYTFHVSDGAAKKWRPMATRRAPSGTLISRGDLLVGDFDGDGRADLVATVDGEWLFSSHGIGPWVHRQTSSVVAAPMVVGDFNGDGAADLLHATGATWRVSYSASASWATLNTSGVTKASMRIGDFNGNGADDVFIVSGTEWRISEGASGGWQTVATSGAALSDLLVGELDGLAGKDILMADGYNWKYSSGARAHWIQLRSSAVPASDLLVGDFDHVSGQWDDLLMTSSGYWYLAPGARQDFVQIARSDFTKDTLLVGDFDGDHKSDLLAE
jgi:hypothetical protein